MKALTANRLDDGAVIYWSQAGWTTQLSEAALLDDASGDAAMRAALSQDTQIVAPYFFALAGPGQPDPRVKARETLRARGGPTAGSTTREG